MFVYTRSRVVEYLGDMGRDITVRVEHNKEDTTAYGIDIGCVDEWLTEDDMKLLVKVFNKALRIRKAAVGS